MLNLQKGVLLLGLVYVKLTRNLRTEINPVSYMRMAKYKDSKENRTKRKVLLEQNLLPVLSYKDECLSIIGPKITRKILLGLLLAN